VSSYVLLQIILFFLLKAGCIAFQCRL